MCVSRVRSSLSPTLSRNWLLKRKESDRRFRWRPYISAVRAAAARGREMFCRDLTIRRLRTEGRRERRQTTDAADAHGTGIRNGPTELCSWKLDRLWQCGVNDRRYVMRRSEKRSTNVPSSIHRCAIPAYRRRIAWLFCGDEVGERVRR